METNSFTLVRPWMNQILNTIKKDLKADHLAVDKTFYQAHFGHRPLNKLSMDEIFAVYEKELLAGNPELCEWVVNRWVFKHGDAYRHFAERLSPINPNFHEIQSLTDAQAEQILAGATESFGAITTYLFSRLNEVVFSENIFNKLYQAALKETEETKDQLEKKNIEETIEQLKISHQRELNRIQEKYEDKLAGVQRKYTVDVEALKKQIRALQRKQ